MIQNPNGDGDERQRTGNPVLFFVTRTENTTYFQCTIGGFYAKKQLF